MTRSRTKRGPLPLHAHGKKELLIGVLSRMWRLAHRGPSKYPALSMSPTILCTPLSRRYLGSILVHSRVLPLLPAAPRNLLKGPCLASRDFSPSRPFLVYLYIVFLRRCSGTLYVRPRTTPRIALVLPATARLALLSFRKHRCSGIVFVLCAFPAGAKGQSDSGTSVSLHERYNKNIGECSVYVLLVFMTFNISEAYVIRDDPPIT